MILALSGAPSIYAQHSDSWKPLKSFEYRLRWDDLVYQPGELKVIAYKEGKQWATDVVKTAGQPEKLLVSTDSSQIANDGRDLAFITVRVADQNDATVPRTANHITFSVEGPGEIVATDNGNPTDLVPFPSHQRDAFSGMALVIVGQSLGRQGHTAPCRIDRPDRHTGGFAATAS